jgi:hypothetical protein
MNSWKQIGVVVEGERINIGGANPWNHTWNRTDKKPVQLPHPSYPKKMHLMDVYEINTGGRSIVFAATELSAGVWRFYVPA